jgi:hypothetical protein
MSVRDLIDFLYARFDEDSRVAQEAKTGFLGWLSTLSLRSPAVALQATYVMHWQPTRALDEIEAKRRRLDVIVNSPGVNREARRRLLLAEASPYYRHPEYRADWHNIDGDTGIPPAPQAPPPPPAYAPQAPPAYAPQAQPAVAPPGPPPNLGPGSGPIPSPGYAQPGPMAPGHHAPDTLGSGQWRP